MERRLKGTGNAFAEIKRRESGVSRPRRFAHRFSASKVLVEQLNLYARLDGHEGCVNTAEFNSTGDLLVSGSDDGYVIFWNWPAKGKTLSYLAGHTENIFQAKIMPFSDDRRVVSSCADGEVRLGEVLENGHVGSKCLGNHEGAVHRLAVEPGSPHILYSCGEDGFIQRFDLRSNSSAKLFRCSTLSENNQQRQNDFRLYDIVIDPRNPFHFAIGGSDQYARVYDIRSYRRDTSSNLDRPMELFCPRHLMEADVHITGLAYSHASELLVSYNDELIYLFEKNMGLGPTSTASPSKVLGVEDPQVYMGHRNSRTVKGVNFFGPHDEYVVSGSDCGHIFIWKKKGAKLLRLVTGDRDVVNQVAPHPHMPFLATCGIESNVKIWMPMEKDDCPLPENVEEILESNKQGREDYFRITLSPDVVMHILQLQSRQASLFTERQMERSEVDFQEQDVEAHILGLLDNDPSVQPNSTSSENQSSCCIS